MSERITLARLRAQAETLTEMLRGAGIISPEECVTVYGAYGGYRYDVTGDRDALAARYGEDRAAWPSGWSGHRTGVAGLVDSMMTAREAHSIGRAVIGALYAARRAGERA